MTDRPILFGAPMVRAILAGTKTQTRRVVKPTRGRPIEFLGGGPRGGADWNNPECWGYEWADGPAFVTLKADPTDRETQQYPCPYGQPSDRLWVREAHLIVGGPDSKNPRVVYAATNDGPDAWLSPVWRPSIHMHRWASRILLEIVSVRVERLQAISETEAQWEGVADESDDDCPRCGGTGLYTAFSANGGALPDTDCDVCDTAKKRFRLLWQRINGADSWEADPWVWVVEFKRVQAPGATQEVQP